MNEKVNERLEQTDRNRKWPWDWLNEPSPKPASVERIVENLPLYARDVYDYVYGIYTSGLPKSYKLYEGFGLYCKVVKKYLQQQYKKVPISFKREAYQTCAKLLELIESLKKAAWSEPYSNGSEPPPPAPDYFADQWDRLIQNLKMCVGSGEQQEQPAERGGNATPAKWWGITTFKNIIEKGWQIFTRSFWDSVFERWWPK